MSKSGISQSMVMAQDAAICLRAGRLQDAAVLYRQILAQEAENHVALFNLAQILKALGEESEFNVLEKRFLALGPRAADVQMRMASYLHVCGDFSGALRCFQSAQGMGIKDLELYRGMGDAYLDSGHPAEALENYRKALKIAPRNAGLHALVADANFGLANYQAAIDSARQALSIDPNLAYSKNTLAWSYLMLGDYQRGWPLHEERFTHASREWLDKFGAGANLEKFAAKPRWQGEDLQGKTILIWAEQGLGDNVMMMRYVSLLVQKGAGACLAYCQPALVRTMLGVTPLVIGTDTLLDINSFDVHCSMMSLPFCFDTRVETIPAPIPYLKVDAAAHKRWKEVLRRFGGLKVGIAWAGSKGMGKDGLRSLALSQFAPLFDVPNVQIVNLQKELGADRDEILQRSGLDWMDACTDLMDTAALIEQLDLVITVDTVIAHLAGALGKPTWLLNRFESEWRWMAGRSDSPWYPSVRMFRQPALHDWGNVIRDVANALTELAAKQGGNRSEPQEWQKAARDADRALGLTRPSDVSAGWRQKIAALWKR